ncbi:hypothetical protein NDU88_006404 [Pleurodeles waltl]|uniref:Uncharacterized protein n=1 Tax=Pleurodeles waltl TaxID=8319 RepID=A0AAV7L7D1_PLEWA|nr:hypothetical protein NDU88_006404 [Pleurodeles waltl]
MGQELCTESELLPLVRLHWTRVVYGGTKVVYLVRLHRTRVVYGERSAASCSTTQDKNCVRRASCCLLSDYTGQELCTESELLPLVSLNRTRVVYGERAASSCPTTQDKSCVQRVSCCLLSDYTGQELCMESELLPLVRLHRTRVVYGERAAVSCSTTQDKSCVRRASCCLLFDYTGQELCTESELLPLVRLHRTRVVYGERVTASCPTTQRRVVYGERAAASVHNSCPVTRVVYGERAAASCSTTQDKNCVRRASCCLLSDYTGQELCTESELLPLVSLHRTRVVYGERAAASSSTTQDKSCVRRASCCLLSDYTGQELCTESELLLLVRLHRTRVVYGERAAASCSTTQDKSCVWRVSCCLLSDYTGQELRTESELLPLVRLHRTRVVYGERAAVSCLTTQDKSCVRRASCCLLSDYTGQELCTESELLPLVRLHRTRVVYGERAAASCPTTQDKSCVRRASCCLLFDYIGKEYLLTLNHSACNL